MATARFFRSMLPVMASAAIAVSVPLDANATISLANVWVHGSAFKAQTAADQQYLDYNQYGVNVNSLIGGSGCCGVDVIAPVQLRDRDNGSTDGIGEVDFSGYNRNPDDNVTIQVCDGDAAGNLLATCMSDTATVGGYFYRQITQGAQLADGTATRWVLAHIPSAYGQNEDRSHLTMVRIYETEY